MKPTQTFDDDRDPRRSIHEADHQERINEFECIYLECQRLFDRTQNKILILWERKRVAMPDTSTLDAYFSSPTDQELVKQAQGGLLTAMQLLFEHYHRQINRYLVYMLGQEGIGEELTQEVFLKAWDAVLEQRPTDNFEDWLYRIATNLVHVYQQRYHLVEQRRWHKDRDNLMPAGDFAEKISAREGMQIPELPYALSQVTFLYRACLILHEIEGLSHAHVARRLGIRLIKVQSSLNRGMQELLQLLPQDSVDVESLMMYLHNLPMPRVGTHSPFSLTSEPGNLQERYYVPYLTVITHYTQPPRISVLTQFSSAFWNANGGESTYKNRQQRTPTWVAFGMMACALLLLMTSSVASNGPSVHYRSATQFFCSPKVIPITASNEDTTLCAHQSRLLHGYTFTLEQASLYTNQLLFSMRLIAPNHQTPVFIITSVLLRVLSPSPMQYRCANNTNFTQSSESPDPTITALAFHSPFLDSHPDYVGPVIFTIQINQLIVIDNSPVNSWRTQPLIYTNDAPIQFNLAFPSHETHVHPDPHPFSMAPKCG